MRNLVLILDIPYVLLLCNDTYILDKFKTTKSNIKQTKI